jgi:hypothetical protein
MVNVSVLDVETMMVGTVGNNISVAQPQVSIPFVGWTSGGSGSQKPPPSPGGPPTPSSGKSHNHE